MLPFRTSLLTRACLSFLALAVPSTAMAECVIYSQDDYAGQFRVLNPNENVPVMGRTWNNRTSAVELSRQCRLVAYEDDNFEGDRLTFRQSTARVDGPLAGRISSAQCQCRENSSDGRVDARLDDAPVRRSVERDRPQLDRPQIERPDRDRPMRDKDTNLAQRAPETAPSRLRLPAIGERREPVNTCMLYTGRNLQGAAVPVGRDRQRSTIPQPLTNDISSLSVPSGCVMRVFDDSRLEGRTTDFATGIYNSLGVTLDNKIGSAQCLCSPEAQRAAAATVQDRAPAPAPALEPLEQDRPLMPRRERLDDLADRGERAPRRNAEPVAQTAACSIYTAPRQAGDVLELNDGDERDLRGPGVSRRVTALVSRMRSIGVRDGCTVSILDRQGDEFLVRSDRDRVSPRLARSAVKASCACEVTNSAVEPGTSDPMPVDRFADDAPAIPRTDTVGGVLGLDDDTLDDRTETTTTREAAADRLAALPGTVPARSCAVYDRTGFRGDRLVIEDGAAFSYIGGRVNDRVSSVQVARNCTLELYENRSFNRNEAGFKAMFNRNQSRLRSGINDAASSAICKCAAQDDLREGRVRPDTQDDTIDEAAAESQPMTLASQGQSDTQNEPRAAVMAPAATAELPRVAQCVLFEHAGLRGEKLSLAPNTAFRWIGSEWSDRVSSATVSNGCELTLFPARDYAGGAERALDAGTYTGLGRWNDRTRSAKCACSEQATEG